MYLRMFSSISGFFCEGIEITDMVPVSVTGNSEKVKGDFVEEGGQQCLGGYLVLAHQVKELYD